MKSLKSVADIPRRVLAIGAHPDDIEINAAGTLAAWVARGCEVTMVICTDGCAGTSDRTLAPATLIDKRRQEQQAAADQLGAKHLVMLGMPDGGLEDTRGFRGELTRLIRRYRPDVIMTHDPGTHARFNHRDHRITGQVTLDAIFPFARDHLHFPEQLVDGLTPHRVDRCLLWDAEDPDTIVDIASTREIKLKALLHHSSQLSGITGGSSQPGDVREWIDQTARTLAEGSEFKYAESFRMLIAPP